MKPGRVLLAGDAVGGVWQYCCELASGLAAREIEVVLAVVGPAPAPHQQRSLLEISPLVRLEHADLPLDWLARNSSELRALAAWLDRLALRHAVDLIHVNGAGIAGHLTAAPVIATHHSCLATWWQAVRGGPLPEDWRWRYARAARGLSAAEIVIAPSRAFAAAITEAYPEAERPQVVHNGRSTPLAAEELPKEPLVLSAGRLWDQGKNAGTLDLAAASFRWPAVALGALEGPAGERFRPKTLHAFGAVSDAEVQRWLRRSSIFVSLARYEPFGLAVLEAAAADNALVLADIPTFRELWEDAAVFVNPSSPTEASAAVNRVIRNRQLRSELAAKAAARAGTYPAIAAVAATLALYRDLLSRSAGVSDRQRISPVDQGNRPCASLSSVTR